MRYMSLLGLVEGSRTQSRQVKGDGKSYTMTDSITQYANGTYTFSAYDGCFDHTYSFSKLELHEVYHQLLNTYSGYESGQLKTPTLQSSKGNEYLFTPGLGQHAAVQELKLVRHRDGHLEIQTYDCT